MDYYRLGALFLGLSWYGVVGDPKIFCVYGSWAAYQKGDGRFLIKNIRTELCDYVIYAYAELSPGGGLIVSGDPSRDLDNLKGAYAQLRNLKRKHPHLKTLIGLGGHRVPATKFSRVSAVPRIREGLGIGAAEFARFHGFDGVALAWFYPGMTNNQDKNNLSHLVKVMGRRLHNYGLEIAVFVSPIKEELLKGYNLDDIGGIADYVFPLTFDYHGPWESKVRHFAPLYEESMMSDTVEGTIRFLTNNKVPASKIALGIGTFGRSFTLEDTSKFSLGSTSIGPGEAGPITKEGGFLGYNELCKKLALAKIIEETSLNHVEGPYTVIGNQWVGFEDQQSVRRKVEFVKSRKLAGVFLWTMDTDDYKNFCRMGSLPLHVAAAHAMGKNVTFKRTL